MGGRGSDSGVGGDGPWGTDDTIILAMEMGNATNWRIAASQDHRARGGEGQGQAKRKNNNKNNNLDQGLTSASFFFCSHPRSLASFLGGKRGQTGRRCGVAKKSSSKCLEEGTMGDNGQMDERTKGAKERAKDSLEERALPSANGGDLSLEARTFESCSWGRRRRLVGMTKRHYKKLLRMHHGGHLHESKPCPWKRHQENGRKMQNWGEERWWEDNWGTGPALPCLWMLPRILHTGVSGEGAREHTTEYTKAICELLTSNGGLNLTYDAALDGGRGRLGAFEGFGHLGKNAACVIARGKRTLFCPGVLGVNREGGRIRQTGRPRPRRRATPEPMARKAGFNGKNGQSRK